MAAPITKLRIGLQPDTPEEHTRLRINVNTEEAQTSLQIATDLRVRANPATAKIYYYNFDGSELLYTETIEPGGSGSWDGEPGRASTQQYEYIFNGWSTEPDQVDPTEDATAGVYSERRVYAAYKRRDISGFLKFHRSSSPNRFRLTIAYGSKSWDGKLFYSFNRENWQEWTGATITASPDGNGEDVIYVRGEGNSVITGAINRGLSSNATGLHCDGNIEFLLDYQSTIEGNHPPMGVNCFAGLFKGVSVESIPELPATTLAEGCYYGMFSGCTALQSAPELPATTLATRCYAEMFSDCTALQSAPELPATTLAEGCYSSMFKGCSTLQSAPELPATTLAPTCYSGMFYGTKAIRTAPELPATTLATGCYKEMFYGAGIVAPPRLPVLALASECYRRMVAACNNIKASETEDVEYSIHYRIPEDGTGTTATNALTDFFKYTGGTFAGTPAINTTYYLAPPASA